jgi:hypothetical protein
MGEAVRAIDGLEAEERAAIRAEDEAAEIGDFAGLAGLSRANSTISRLRPSSPLPWFVSACRKMIND